MPNEKNAIFGWFWVFTPKFRLKLPAQLYLGFLGHFCVPGPGSVPRGEGGVQPAPNVAASRPTHVTVDLSDDPMRALDAMSDVSHGSEAIRPLRTLAGSGLSTPGPSDGGPLRQWQQPGDVSNSRSPLLFPSGGVPHWSVPHFFQWGSANIGEFVTPPKVCCAAGYYCFARSPRQRGYCFFIFFIIFGGIVFSEFFVRPKIRNICDFRKTQKKTPKTTLFGHFSHFFFFANNWILEARWSIFWVIYWCEF